MKRIVTFEATCECGWTTGPLESCAKVQKAVKRHIDDNPHRDFEDVPLPFGEQR